MTKNTTQFSANGGYIGISSEDATLTTAILDVINEMEAQGAPITQTQIAIAFNSTSGKNVVVAIIKRHG